MYRICLLHVVSQDGLDLNGSALMLIRGGAGGKSL